MSSADTVVLRTIEEYVIGTTPTAMAASGQLIATANPANSDTVTIDGKTYTLQTTLTNVDGNVQLGATMLATLQNLMKAINLTGAAGVDYAAAMTLHATVTAVAVEVETLFVRAKTGGTAGNALATTEASTVLSWVAATLLGGLAGPTMSQLRFTGESLKSQIENTRSAEITPSRADADLVQTALSGSGDINIELSYSSFAEQLAAAMCSYWRDGAGDTLVLRNGSHRRSFTIQKHFQDLLTKQYHNFRGCCYEGFSLTMEIGKIVTGALNVMSFGLNPSTGVASGQFAGATLVAAPTTTPLNAIANLQDFTIAGVPYTGCISKLTLELKNNLRARQCLGSLTPTNMVLGSIEITGSMEFYFDEGTTFESFVAGTEFDMGFVLEDVDGNKYTIAFERCKFETGEVVAGGKNSDVMFVSKYRGLYDATTDRVIQITADPA